jgi:hypothetical protein
MDYTVFRAALRVSAKVAVTTTLVSCGGAIADAPVPDDAMAIGDSPACNPPPAMTLLADAASGASVTSTTFSCCASEVAAAFGINIEDGAVGHALDGAPEPGDLADCCAVVVFADNPYRPYPAQTQAGQEHFWCCEMLDWPPAPGLACTPWGPPMPPAMPGQVA